MSLETITKCDHCGKSLSLNHKGMLIQVYEHTGSSYGVPNMSGHYDLCDKCASQYRQALSAILFGRVRRCPYCDQPDGKDVMPLRDDEYDHAEVNPKARQIEITHWYYDENDCMQSLDTFIDINRCPVCGRVL